MIKESSEVEALAMAEKDNGDVYFVISATFPETVIDET